MKDKTVKTFNKLYESDKYRCARHGWSSMWFPCSKCAPEKRFKIKESK